MFIVVWEGKYPCPVDKEQVEDCIKNVVIPTRTKAGYKNQCFAWMSIGGPTNLGILIGEIESLADIERVATLPEMEKAGEEFFERFPDVELTRRILEVVE